MNDTEEVFTFSVEVTVSRQAGRSLSRDELLAALQDRLEWSDPNTLPFDDSSYEVLDWTVTPS